MVQEILREADGLKQPPQLYLDATFGRGGHVKALCDHFQNLQVMALDRDPAAVEHARLHFPHVQIFHHDFLQFQSLYRERIAPNQFDLILLDLGVSSPQLDEAARGFSFYHDGPLDMRMDPRRGEPASVLINTWSREDLITLFQTLGEIRRPQRVVDKIVENRPFSTTTQLSELIARCEGWRKKGQHPATRYFLALRLEVNQELPQVRESLPYFIEALKVGGRLLVLTFHSLEDRIVKYSLRESTLGEPVHKKVIQPQWSEQKRNPRARSAKLRVFERTATDERQPSPRDEALS